MSFFVSEDGKTLIGIRNWVSNPPPNIITSPPRLYIRVEISRTLGRGKKNHDKEVLVRIRNWVRIKAWVGG